jgi:hypothetical protein
MAANYPADTPRSRMLGSTWNYETASAGTRVHRARRRREKQGWIDVDATIREAREDEVQSLLEQGSWPLTED